MSVVFNPGDKVRLTRGEEVLNGEVVDLTGTVWAIDPAWKLGVKTALGTETIPALLNEGWQVSVVLSTPTPEPLPSDDGIYLSSNTVDGPWLFELKGGDWTCINTNSPFPIGDGHLERNAPFTRLGSRESWRASWASEIADWFDKKSDAEGSIHWAGDAIRAQFGGAVVDE